MTSREQLLETAIELRVEMLARESGGQRATDFYVSKVQPAVVAALDAGCHPSEIHEEADRRYATQKRRA